MRLNLWGLLYVLLAGWLRFGRAGRASWLAARAVLAVAIALQYAAGVSLPPSVWAEPARRPWVTWGAGWPAGAETCARLGSNATTTDGKVGEQHNPNPNPNPNANPNPIPNPNPNPNANANPNPNLRAAGRARGFPT